MSRIPSRRWRAALAFALALTVVPWAALAALEPVFTLVIRDHKFEPSTLTIPAKTRVTLMIHNADPTPEEFESATLNREKVIPGNAKAIIYIGPLDAGTYPFVGEFHEDTAKGMIVAK